MQIHSERKEENITVSRSNGIYLPEQPQTVDIMGYKDKLMQRRKEVTNEV